MNNTTPTTACCDKCEGMVETYCANPDCPCHRPTTSQDDAENYETLHLGETIGKKYNKITLNGVTFFPEQEDHTPFNVYKGKYHPQREEKEVGESYVDRWDIESWEEEFGRDFPYLKHSRDCAGRRHYSGTHPFDCNCGAIDENAATVEAIKSFIRKATATARAQARAEVREELLGRFNELAQVPNNLMDMEVGRIKALYLRDVASILLEEDKKDI